MLGSYVRVKVTNPIHSLNTQFGFDYKLNYGTIEGKKVFGSSPACAYILGVNQPVRTYDGRVVAVLKRSDGTSVYIVSPKNMKFVFHQIADAVSFAEDENNYTAERLFTGLSTVSFATC